MSPRTAVSAVALAATLAVPLPAQQKVELPGKDRPVTLQARTLFQVGEVEGADYETFAEVMDVAFDAKGNLYVLDATAHRVIVFDATGRFVRMIGRQGGGPGEFGMPTALAVLPTGELVVNDAAKGNLQLFSPSGEYLRSVSLGEDLGRAVGRMRPGGGGIVTETMQLRRMREGSERGTLERLQLPPRSVTSLAFGDTVAGRRLYNAPPRETRLTTPQTANGGTTRISMSITAFDPSLLWTPLPAGGIAAMHSEHYRVVIVDPSGRPLRYLERPLEPRKVTDADRKQFMDNRKSGAGMGAAGGAAVVAFSTRTGGGSAGPPPPNVMRMDASAVKESDISWNDVIPVVRALGTDSFGRLWVQRTAPDLGDGPIDLVDAGLRYLGTLAPQPMPRAFGPDGRVAYIERDELDVQTVVVKQLLK